MPAYYNELDPHAAQWLRNLIARNLIAPGEVDERSIIDVRPDDLRGFEQCHFFAGIGGWSYALRLAGWPDDRLVWTGSCPCQPFSAAGKQGGSEDERHLWPAFFRLIRECKPATVFGEQVAGAAGLAWIDHVHADLEESGYAVAATDLPACSVGAPHRRQRLWWVADAQGCDGEISVRERRPKQEMVEPGGRGRSGDERVDDPAGARLESARCGSETEARHEARLCGSECGRDVGRLADPESERWCRGQDDENGGGRERSLGYSSPWRGLEWLPCSDGKARPTQPGLFPLAHGIPGRVGRLRAYGNAIVPQVAAEFIAAYMECKP